MKNTKTKRARRKVTEAVMLTQALVRKKTPPRSATDLVGGNVALPAADDGGFTLGEVANILMAQYPNDHLLKLFCQRIGVSGGQG